MGWRGCLSPADAEWVPTTLLLVLSHVEIALGYEVWFIYEFKCVMKKSYILRFY